MLHLRNVAVSLGQTHSIRTSCITTMFGSIWQQVPSACLAVWWCVSIVLVCAGKRWRGGEEGEGDAGGSQSVVNESFGQAATAALQRMGCAQALILGLLSMHLFPGTLSAAQASYIRV